MTCRSRPPLGIPSSRDIRRVAELVGVARVFHHLAQKDERRIVRRQLAFRGDFPTSLEYLPCGTKARIGRDYLVHRMRLSGGPGDCKPLSASLLLSEVIERATEREQLVQSIQLLPQRQKVNVERDELLPVVARPRPDLV